MLIKSATKWYELYNITTKLEKIYFPEYDQVN